jgi:hypothetical protein
VAVKGRYLHKLNSRWRIIGYSEGEIEPDSGYREAMKSRIATISALAGVLLTGVAAAAVNTQALQGSANPEVAVTNVADANLTSSDSAYNNNGLVTDISAFEAVPSPVIEYQYVTVPAPVTPAAPKAHKASAKKKSVSKSSSSSSNDDEGEDEDDDEGEDD